MLIRYLQAAMRLARYEIVEDSGSYYGEIPGFAGVWASAPTLEACRDQLLEVLEGWVLIALRRGDAVPEVDGIDLSLREVA